MTRQMTPAEKRGYKTSFPNLNVDQTIVSGEATEVYNCISWTVGETSQWLFPGVNLSDFDTFYRLYGLTRAQNGEVAAWGHASNAMTHGSISGPGHGTRWESKCGPGLRIQHGLNELVGTEYGRVVAFYTRNLSIENKAEKFIPILMKEKKQFTKDEIAYINEEINKLSPKLISDFEKYFSFWKETWFKGRLAFNSNPASRISSLEFFRLLDMGEKIIPLVIKKLMDKENFIALQLYERLQNKPNLLVEHNVHDELILEGEQGRAFRTVRSYIRNK